MSVLVTLDIFSGRENPTWMLSEDQVKDLVGRRNRNKAAFVRGASPSVLGYRGFSLREARSDTGATLAQAAGRTAFSGRVADGEVEEFLLSTMPEDALQSEVRALVRGELGRPAQLIAEAAAAPPSVICPKCVAVDAPAYNPAFWNQPSIQPRNNCYNYANNRATNTFAQPGRAHGAQTSTMQCAQVNAAAIKDGLRNVPNFTTPLAKGRGWYVALVIWPNVDYHWYRQDNVGCWSHKPGQTAARNTDNSGKPITDPRTCNRGGYIQFCGYMNTGSWVVIS